MNGHVRGSFTIEASLIFPIVVFTLLFIVYTAFYMHNRAVIQEAVYETALYGTILDQRKPDEMKQKMQKKCRNAIEGRLIAMKKPQVSMEAGKDGVTVKLHGKMDTVSIGFLPDYNGWIVSAEKSVSYGNPLQTIRLIRVLKMLKE